MPSTTHTEEEFKQLLKNLFTEKKRVKDLQKQFQSKLTGIHKLSTLEEESENLKTENLQLRDKIERVRPALKKLVEDLKEARLEVEELKKPKENEEKNQLVARLADALNQVQKQTDQIKELQEEMAKIHQEYEVGEEKRRRYEERILELKQDLETSVIAKNENLALKNHLAQVEEQIACDRQEFMQKTSELELKDKELYELSALLEEAKEQLQASDLGEIREEYEAKIFHLDEQLKRALEELLEKERISEKSYEEMRDLSSRNGDLIESIEKLKAEIAEMEQGYKIAKSHAKSTKLQYEQQNDEILKAQQHLAKKVKEATMLRDLTEEQSEKIDLLQGMLDGHEEKAQIEMKQWQDKFFALQEQWQEQKGRLVELEKMSENYDQMSATVNNLKNVLGKTGDSNG